MNIKSSGLKRLSWPANLKLERPLNSKIANLVKSLFSLSRALIALGEPQEVRSSVVAMNLTQ